MRLHQMIEIAFSFLKEYKIVSLYFPQYVKIEKEA